MNESKDIVFKKINLVNVKVTVLNLILELLLIFWE